MAATYLQLTNELLRELNEVALTASNFANAIGIQQHVKDCVNRAYLDIVNEEPQWPFLAVAASGDTDPFYGNTYVETAAGTRWYELKPSSDSLLNDYGYVDWDNFYITTIGVSGATEPYTSRNLRYITIEEFKDFHRAEENNDNVLNLSSITSALLRAATGLEPEATTYNTEISGRKIGDITNDGTVNVFDVTSFLSYEVGSLTNQTEINYIENTLIPYLRKNIYKSGGEPRRVFKSPDNRKFGLSPIPDDTYRVWFYAYALPTELSVYSDQIVIPNTYRSVLLARARYYIHQFKENSQAAAFALEDYRRGLRLMKSNLMEPAPDYMKDDRVRFV